jgi:type IV pilus assembly protein PilE
MKRFHREKGFTLIEAMITVAVLAVVAAIAVPAYTGYVATTREAEGWNNLNALKIAEEQYFLERNTYFGGADAGAISTASGGLWTIAEQSGTENFGYDITATATSYTATATGKNKVKTTVKLICSMTSGQSKCYKP